MAYEDIRSTLDATDIATMLMVSQRLDLAPGPGGSRFAPYDEAIRHIKPMLSWHLPGDWQQATVIALYPSQQIVAHCDPPIIGTRYHIPIQMNDGCWVFSGGVWQQLHLGHTYRMDPTELHGAVNWGADVRLHVMVDVA